MASRSRGCRHIVRCRMRNTHTHTRYILCKRPNVDKDEMAYAMDTKHSAHEVVCGVYAHTYVAYMYVVYMHTRMWHICAHVCGIYAHTYVAYMYTCMWRICAHICGIYAHMYVAYSDPQNWCNVLLFFVVLNMAHVYVRTMLSNSEMICILASCLQDKPLIM